jgi:hypothetical protein
MPQTIFSRVAPEHRQKLVTPITAEQSAALRGMLLGGLMRPVVPDETKAALAAAGYGEERAGGFALTQAGQVRAFMENGQ